MRRFLLAAILTIVPLTGASADIVFPFEGNDLGGIIAWSPANQRHMRAIAAAHCALYGKVARITSVWPRYGQYIGFACRFPRGYKGRGPSSVVLRARD